MKEPYPQLRTWPHRNTLSPSGRTQPSRLNRGLAGRLHLPETHAIHSLYHGLQDMWKPFLGRHDTGYLLVCCTIQDKVQDLKAVEETAEGLQRLKTAKGIVDGLSLAKNCGGLWEKRVILFDTKKQKGERRQ